MPRLQNRGFAIRVWAGASDTLRIRFGYASDTGSHTHRTQHRTGQCRAARSKVPRQTAAEHKGARYASAVQRMA
eukprot:3743379-Rhodomonas_salina.3